MNNKAKGTEKATFDLLPWQVAELRKYRLKNGRSASEVVRRSLTAFFAVEGVKRAERDFARLEKQDREEGMG